MTRGSSGPTTTMSILFFKTNSLIPSKSRGDKIMFLPYCFVPAFPGAINNSSKIELCEIFQAKACSLPPDPSNNIFIYYLNKMKVLTQKYSFHRYFLKHRRQHAPGVASYQKYFLFYLLYQQYY